ncbi:MAG: hypothetical protein SV598_11845 [Pseudomonadota bacterium]|nr:hypothetical protein [Pseudomonadota bacterium]
MSRLYVIGLAAFAWLAVLASLAGVTTPGVAGHQQSGHLIGLEDLVVGGVPTNAGQNSPVFESRNPFRFAPTFLEDAYSPMPEPPSEQPLLAGLNLTLEGVQLRGGKFTAFVSYQGQRRPLRTGDRIGDQLVVAHIEEDRIQVIGNGNEARWIYLTQ